MKKICILFAIALFGCGIGGESDGAEVFEGHVSQALSACLDGGGRNLSCTTGSIGLQCSGGGAEGNCYCPEATSTELAYCNNSRNCSRPEYASHCAGGCGGTPTFVHWCVSGQMP